MKIWWLVLIVLVIGWFLLGNPSKDFANWFWPNDAAPWETVDAFFYPDRGDLLKFITQRDFGDLEACRDWVSAQAIAHNDPMMDRADYECGVGYIESGGGGLRIYRITVR